MAAGCPGSGQESGPDASLSSPTAPCVVTDTACLDELPHPGSPCEGNLDCVFTEASGDAWQYACRGGIWQITDRICDDDMCPRTPPLVQYCRDEFTGTIENGSIAIGPLTGEGGFERFEDQDFIDITYGSQGSPMLGFRVQLTGAENVECARISINATIPGDSPADAIQRVQMHCGLSLGVYLVLPWSIECEERVFPLQLHVDVAGVGVTTLNLQFMGGGACFG